MRYPSKRGRRSSKRYAKKYKKWLGPRYPSQQVVETQAMTRQYHSPVVKVHTIDQTRIITNTTGGYPLDMPFTVDIWDLQNLPQFSTWNSVYEQYKVIGAKVTLIPFHKYNYGVIHAEYAGFLDRHQTYSFGSEPGYTQCLASSGKKLGHTSDFITLTYKPRGKLDPQREWRDLTDAGTSSVQPYEASFNFRAGDNVSDNNSYYTAVIERCILFRGIK